MFKKFACGMTIIIFFTGSLHAQSIAASRVEHALSEVASSLSSFTPRPGPQRAWLLQVQIWLLLAEIYIEMDEMNWAASCIQEATSIYPLSHQVMFMVRTCSYRSNLWVYSTTTFHFRKVYCTKTKESIMMPDNGFRMQ